MPGVYIHIPFCRQKCRYCDFVSFSADEQQMAEYLDALEREMAAWRGVTAETVFIGGGTPTALSPALLERLLNLVKQNFSLLPETEFSAEANPGTLTTEKLAILKAGGVNRLSIGVQSFLADELSCLGRIHSPETAKNTVRMAKAAGFDNINIDLMSGLPGQTLEKFQKSLAEAVALEPEHISCYSLILEEGTPLAAAYDRGEVTLPEEEIDRKMYELACQFLRDNGYWQYEISNFAKPGHACRHNLLYWDALPYIGLGVAAHGFDGSIRRENTAVFSEYLRGEGIGRIEAVLSETDRMSEFMILGLRKTQGVQEAEFFSRFQKPLQQVYQAQLAKFTASGFLQCADGRVRLTPKGISVSNSVLCEFIIDEMGNP